MEQATHYWANTGGSYTKTTVLACDSSDAVTQEPPDCVPTGYSKSPSIPVIPLESSCRVSCTCRGGAADLNVASTLSEASEQWTAERVQQLEEDKAAIERLWGEHAQENDIGVLKFKLVCLLPPSSRLPVCLLLH